MVSLLYQRDTIRPQKIGLLSIEIGCKVVVVKCCLRKSALRLECDGRLVFDLQGEPTVLHIIRNVNLMTEMHKKRSLDHMSYLTRQQFGDFFLSMQYNDRNHTVNLVENLSVKSGEHVLLIDEAHFWLNGYVNKQNCRIWSEANPQVYVETPLHPEKLTVWCALWAGGILLQKR
ncbi:uncharacterized protein TNCV_1725691 [Trichonephila clavipes]|nr:uncharacterized protein TNCV_1725691 [Trichonephila clavipes]